MRLLARLTLLATVLCLLSACGNQEPAHAAEIRQVRQEAEKKVHEAERQRFEADKARNDAEKARLEAERARKDAEKARLEAERARKDAEASKSAWQNATLVLAVSVFLALLIGIMLGSSARKDSSARGASIDRPGQ